MTTLLLLLGATVIVYVCPIVAATSRVPPLGPTTGAPVIVIVNVKVPAWLRIPEMLPISGLRTNPGGNAP